MAEQFGCRYAGPSAGSRSMNQPFLAFRRSAELRDLAALTLTRYPDPAGGGPPPGMVAGHGLRPAQSAAADVRLIHSRMIVDACARCGATRSTTTSPTNSSGCPTGYCVCVTISTPSVFLRDSYSARLAHIGRTPEFGEPAADPG